jgi:DNA-binding beta-propeller fold protein YncE
MLYVADTGHRCVLAIDLTTPGLPATEFAGNGAAGNEGDGGPATLASFLAPVDVDCDAQGNVYVCDRDAAVVRRVDAFSRTISTVAGSGVPGYAGDGGPAASARLDLPSGICVDRVRGRLYVADSGNHVVRVVWE